MAVFSADYPKQIELKLFSYKCIGKLTILLEFCKFSLFSGSFAWP